MLWNRLSTSELFIIQLFLHLQRSVQGLMESLGFSLWNIHGPLAVSFMLTFSSIKEETLEELAERRCVCVWWGQCPQESSKSLLRPNSSPLCAGGRPVLWWLDSEWNRHTSHGLQDTEKEQVYPQSCLKPQLWEAGGRWRHGPDTVCVRKSGLSTHSWFFAQIMIFFRVNVVLQSAGQFFTVVTSPKVLMSSHSTVLLVSNFINVYFHV